MMNFRRINSAITALLGSAAAGRYRVIGYLTQGKAANTTRVVQSFFSSGDFPKSAGRLRATTMHQMSFELALSVSAPALVDLRVINSANASPDQITAALSKMQEASAVADGAMDELYEILYQIIMDARNYDLRLGKAVVTDRWISALRKNPPMPQGELVTLTGTVMITCATSEQVTGDPGVVMSEGISTQLVVGGDEIGVAGVVVEEQSNGAPGVTFEDGNPRAFENKPEVTP